MTTSFQAWHAEADIPVRGEDGRWYDAETGFAFKPAPRAKAPAADPAYAARVDAARAQAAERGLAALEGTAAQRAWAETIRAELLANSSLPRSISEGLRLVSSAKDLIEFHVFCKTRQLGPSRDALTRRDLASPQLRASQQKALAMLTSRVEHSQKAAAADAAAAARHAEKAVAASTQAKAAAEQARAALATLLAGAAGAPEVPAVEQLGRKVAERLGEDGTRVMIFLAGGLRLSEQRVRFIFKRDGVRTHRLSADEGLVAAAMVLSEAIRLGAWDAWTGDLT